MSYTCFEVDIEDQIAHIVLSRPDKLNTMVPEFWDELPAIVEDIDADARARAIVISSTGKHFTAGLDIKAFTFDSAPSGDPEKQKRAGRQRAAGLYQTIRRMQHTFSALEACRLPVLAAIQGGCIGGGVDMITACDMRYATRDSFVTIFEINIGMTADVGTFPRLAKLIPEGIVRELAYTGRRMPAEEAQAAGLINQVFPDQQTMLAGVMDIAREIASKPPLAIHGCKRMITYARDHNTADGLDYIGVWNAGMLQPEEMVEAMAARAENRQGDFVDLPKIRRSTGGDGKVEI